VTLDGAVVGLLDGKVGQSVLACETKEKERRSQRRGEEGRQREREGKGEGKKEGRGNEPNSDRA